MALISLASDGDLEVGIGKVQELNIAETDRVHRDGVVVGLDGSGELHFASDRSRIDASKLDLSLIISGKERESPLPQHVILGIILHARVGEIKEEGQRKLGSWHSGELGRHALGQAKAQDSVHTLEIGGVADSDSSKLVTVAIQCRCQQLQRNSKATLPW